MAQKQRLQQLESEYALKIQKLKEAQALRNKGVQPDLPPEATVPASASPEREPQSQVPACSSHFPQPSLHDLTLDKLNLESDDVCEADDHEAESAPGAAAAAGGRRHSFRQCSSSFTKPHLEQQSATPVKDAAPGKAPKASASPSSSAEVFAKLDVEALKKRYQQLPPLREVLHRELNQAMKEAERLPVEEVNTARTAASVLKLSPVAGVTSLAAVTSNNSMLQCSPLQLLPLEVDTNTNQSGNFMLKPVPFSPYRSPLLAFKSYR